MTNIQILTSHLGLLGLGSTLYLSQILKTFSRRMGEVTKMPPYYRWFDVSSIFISIAFLGQAMLCSAALAGRPAILFTDAFALYTFYLPLAVGAGIDIGVALVYWGWLIHEH